MNTQENSIDVSYRVAQPHELDAISRLAAQSFGEYPFFAFVFREQFDSYPDYLNYMTALDRMVIKAYMSKKICLIGESHHRIVSIALLDNPDTRAIGISDYIRAGGLGLVKGVGLVRLLEFFTISERAQQDCKLRYSQSWYVEMLAVDTHLKGQGLGTRMIHECVIPFARFHNGSSLSLITNTEKNRRFYQANGFTEFSQTLLENHGNTISNWSFYMNLAN
jgi:ribosomal protein S18 acetylase RimI-like enzyme